MLRLVAEGCSNPQIAKRLYISRRTAEHHVQHIYAKIGVSSGLRLALFALERDLLADTAGRLSVPPAPRDGGRRKAAQDG